VFAIFLFCKVQGSRLRRRPKKSARTSESSMPSFGLLRIGGSIRVAGRYHRPPRRIEDDYDLTDELLGRGETGDVTAAFRRRQGNDKQQKFAVKTCPLANIKHAKFQMLLSEVETFLYVDHPHIARLYDVYESGERLYFVMECLQGGELFERFSRLGKFAEPDVSDLVVQILLALNYIHKHGIVHRDIKLQNLMYQRSDGNHVKFIDFGFSKLLDSSMRLKKAVGTLLYVAPEVLQKNYDSQCDMWSLGVIAFVLLAGYFPFSGENLAEDIQAGKLDWKPSHWANISDCAADFVKALLKVDPKERLTAHAALEHSWIQQARQLRSLSVDVHSAADALVKFSHVPKFRRCCMMLLAWSLTADERAGFRQQFTWWRISMDADGRGTLSLAMLKSTLARSLQLPEEEAQLVCRALGADTHEMSYTEFLGAMLSAQSEKREAMRVASLFRRFDTDNSGSRYLTAESLSSFCHRVSDEPGAEEQFRAAFRELDTDNDGRVSCAELEAYLRREVAVPPSPPVLSAGAAAPRAGPEAEGGAPRAARLLSCLLGWLPLRCCQRPAR
ncbi:unnamed protein product, partial [Prorocentrum cordatum]